MASAGDRENVVFSNPGKRVHEERLARPRPTPNGYQIQRIMRQFSHRRGCFGGHRYALRAGRTRGDLEQTDGHLDDWTCCMQQAEEAETLMIKALGRDKSYAVRRDKQHS